MPILLAFAAVLAAGLFAWGAVLDAGRPLDQTLLFAGLQAASLGGAAVGVGLSRVLAPRPRPAWQWLLGLVSWRLAYFPIMVFSGHVASIGEWGLASLGLPIAVYPVFLLSVAALHGVAGLALTWLVHPPRPWLRLALAPAFATAALVSFNQLSDLRLLPDTTLEIDAAVPPMRSGGSNPYLPALLAEGYLPNQRVVLLAAGLTYETIPPSPWATTVKAVLEGLFHATPHGSTRDRVLEHYLAYHSAHSRIGCRDLADCPALPAP